MQRGWSYGPLGGEGAGHVVHCGATKPWARCSLADLPPQSGCVPWIQLMHASKRKAGKRYEGACVRVQPL